MSELTPTGNARPVTMTQAVVTGPGTVELQDAQLPTLRPGYALVRVLLVGLCGVDLSLMKGYSQYLTEGLKEHPFVLGHEWVGICIDVFDERDTELVGQRVVGHNFVVCGRCAACRSGRQENCSNRSEIGVLGEHQGALAEYLSVPVANLAVVPDAISAASAVLLEPASTAMHAVVRTRLRAAERVLVIGTGTLALCALLVSKALGAEVSVVGIDPGGLEFARSLGAHQALAAGQVPESSYDVVIEASGAPSALADAFRAVAGSGRIALVGVPNTTATDLPVAQLVMKNADVYAIYSGIHQWEALIRLVETKHIPLEVLVESTVALTDIRQGFEVLASTEKARPKVLIQVGDAL